MKPYALRAALFAAAIAVSGQAFAETVLRYATISEPPSLDVQVGTATIASTISMHMFETLYAFDAGFEPQPLLASGDRIEDGGLPDLRSILVRLHLELQPGAAWQLHLRRQAQPAVLLVGLDAPEIECIPDLQFLRIPAPAAHSHPAGEQGTVHRRPHQLAQRQAAVGVVTRDIDPVGQSDDGEKHQRIGCRRDVKAPCEEHVLHQEVQQRDRETREQQGVRDAAP